MTTPAPTVDTAAAGLELRVLLGLQAGSRLPLPTGEHALGSGDDCTVILGGPRIAARHATLLIGAGDPRVRPDAGPVLDAQGRALTQETPFAPGVPIDLGGVWITVDRLEAPWPDMHAFQPGRPGVAADTVAAGPASRAAAGGTFAAARGPRVAWRRAIVVGLLVAVLSSSVATVMASWWRVTAPTIDAAPPLLASEHDDAAPPASAASAVSSEQPAAPLPSPDELLVAAQEALVAVDGPGSLRFAAAGTAGSLKLLGAARSESQVDETAREVIRRVPGLHRLEAEVLLPEALLRQLKDDLAEAGLARRLTIVRESPEVVLSGHLAVEERARWQALYDRFRAAYGDALPLRAQLDGSPPELPFVVQAVVGGPSPYFVTDEGVRVIRGGRIAGRTLVGIQNGELVFEGGERLRYMR